jgi:hypothetical protein
VKTCTNALVIGRFPRYTPSITALCFAPPHTRGRGGGARECGVYWCSFSYHYTKRAFIRHLPRASLFCNILQQRRVVSTEAFISSASIEAGHRGATVPASRS